MSGISRSMPALAASQEMQERAAQLRGTIAWNEGTWGGTMFHYPRRKIVMTEPANIPGFGKIGKRIISKEELLETWQKAIDKVGVKVEEGIQVTGIDGEDGAFSVHTSKGIVEARKVVLACGRRGTPRKMGVPGEELEKVTYGFTDAEQYDGRRVLVVGGGDSALEAAIAIAELGTAEVALSYRGAELSRARQANRDKAAALVESGQLMLLLPSQVKYVTPEEVRMDWDGRELRLPNDDIIVNIGGDPPDGFLKKAGVEMRRYSGEQLGAKIGEDYVSEAEMQNRRRLRRTLALYGVLGAVIFLVIGLVPGLGWMTALGFAIGAALAGLAGGLLVTTYGVNSGVGVSISTKAFIMIMIGGAGVTSGAIVGVEALVLSLILAPLATELQKTKIAKLLDARAVAEEVFD